MEWTTKDRTRLRSLKDSFSGEQLAGYGPARYSVQSGQIICSDKQGGTTENSFVPEWTEVFFIFCINDME